MDRNRCPACGARGYTNNRCGECLYKPFDEEISHRNHYHAGEPLVVTTRRPVTPSGKGCASYPGKRMPKFRIPRPLLYLAGIAVALLVPGGVLLVGIVFLIATVLKGLNKQ